MFSAIPVNHKINRLHERGLRPLSTGESSIFKDMPSKRKDTTIHIKNIQKVTIEFHKFPFDLLILIIKEVLTKRVLKYNLRSFEITLL